MKKLFVFFSLILFVLQNTQAQNVGIGTSSPNAQLHIKYALANTSNGVPALIIDNPTGGTQTSLQFQVNGVETGRIRSSSNGSLTYATVANGDHIFRNQTDDNDLMIIEASTGNVGIGTTTPESKLDIRSTGDIMLNLQSASSTAHVRTVSPAGVEAGANFSTVMAGIVRARWVIGKGDGAETGSNEGSNLIINRYDDAGAYLGRPLEIVRKTGEVVVNNKLTAASFQLLSGGSSGNVLQTDGSGNASWVSPSLLSSSVWTVSGNNIYKNNSGNVGIGSSSPSELLHVGTSNGTDNYIKVESGGTSSNYSGIKLNEPGFDFGWTLRQNAATDDLTLDTQDGTFTNIATFKRNGNVGIGTTSPGSTLHVKYPSANTATFTPVLILDNPSGGSQTSLQFRIDGTETGRIRSDINGNMIYSTVGSGDQEFRQGDVNSRMIIKGGTGYVGIGTASPDALLHITDGNLYVQGTFGSSPTFPATGSGERMFFYSRKAAFRAGHAFNNNWDDANIGDYSIALGYSPIASGEKSIAMGTGAFASNTNSTAIGNTARADGTASIALGHNAYSFADFSAALGSATSANANNSVAVGSNNISQSFAEVTLGSFNTTYTPNSTSSWDANDRILTVGNGSSNGSRSTAMVIMKNGRVGIGTTTPTDELQVVGRTKTTDFQMTNGANNGYLLQSNASGQAIWVYPGSIIPAGTGLSYSGTTLNSVWTASGNDIYKNNTGNVGIGTSSPSALLHVNNSSGTASITIQSGTSNAYLNMNAGASGMETSIASYTSGVQRWSFGKSNGAESGSNVGSDFFINRYDDAGSFQGQPFIIKRSTGNIGIGGIGSPVQKVDVSGNINVSSGNGYYIGNTKILSNSGTDNLFAGASAGASTTGSSNTFIGRSAGQSNTNGTDNTALGINSLNGNTSGNFNTAIGGGAGLSSNGSNNVLLGYGAGVTVGSNNVIIGFGAGGSETGSNKLYIDNSNTSSPLIQGDFSTNELTVNGSMDIMGAMGLKIQVSQVAGTNNPNTNAGIWVYSSGSGTIDLTPAASVNRMFVIINITGAARSITAYRDLTNALVNTIANNTSLWLVHDGTNWRQIK